MSKENPQKLQEALDALCEVEDKIKVALDFMRSSLAQEGSPRLRDFWEAKAVCLPLFKQRVAPAARAYFWEEFVELSDEARRLKEVLDEQSAFAASAIDLAIEAIEKEFASFDEKLTSVQTCPFPKSVFAIDHRKDFYDQCYRGVFLLTNFSSQLNSLRQEVSKTSMRVRQKGRIFQKLQELKDQILPRRSQIIDEVSRAFIEDVTAFVDGQQEKTNKPFYVLRDEIKALQELSKILSISTDTFAQVRELLSGLWDKIRLLDKERKKNQNEKKQSQQKNLEEALEKIAELEKRIEDENLKLDKAKPLFGEIYTYLRNIDLHRDGVSICKNKLKELQDSLKAPKTSGRTIDAERIEAKREQEANVLKDEQARIDGALKECKGLGVDAGFEKLYQLESEIQHDQLLDPVRDLLVEKKHAALLESEEALVEEVEAVIEVRQKQKKRLKQRHDEVRKALGGSNLDFERSMQLDQELTDYKKKLESVDEAIRVLTDLISNA